MKRTELKRKTRIRRQSPKKAASSRSSGTKTGMPIRHSKTKRKPRSECETTRIYGSREFRDWFHTLPCAGCGIRGYTQMAHVGNGGMGKKSRAERAIPLCGPHPNWQQRTMGYAMPMEKGCHQTQHDGGAKSFAASRGAQPNAGLADAAAGI